MPLEPIRNQTETKDEVLARESKSRVVTNWLIVIISSLSFVSSLHLFKKAEIVVLEGTNNVQIQQRMGILNFYQFFSIKNTGEKFACISKIKISIRSLHSSDFKKTFVAENFNTIGSYVPFIDLYLQGGGYFSGIVQLVEVCDKKTLDTANVLQTKVYNETSTFKKDSTNTFIWASKTTQDEVDSFIRSRLQKFEKGRYEYTIELSKDNDSIPFFNKTYTFDLSSIETDQLIRSIEENQKICTDPYRECFFPNIRIQLE